MLRLRSWLLGCLSVIISCEAADDVARSVTLEVRPQSVSVYPREVVTFAVFSPPTTTTAIQWDIVEKDNAGSIDDAGAYHAPATSGVFHVVAYVDGVTATAEIVVRTCAEILSKQESDHLDAVASSQENSMGLGEINAFIASSTSEREQAELIPGFRQLGSDTNGRYVWSGDHWEKDSTTTMGTDVWQLVWNDGSQIFRTIGAGYYHDSASSATILPNGVKLLVYESTNLGVGTREVVILQSGNATWDYGYGFGADAAASSWHNWLLYQDGFGEWYRGQKTPYGSLHFDVSDENPPRDIVHYVFDDGNDTVVFEYGWTWDAPKGTSFIDPHSEEQKFAFVSWNDETRYFGLGSGVCRLDPFLKWFHGFDIKSPVSLTPAFYLH